MMIKSRKVVLLSKWNKNDLICACLFFNPLCSNCKECEELEVIIKPYDDVEECLKNKRGYKRHNGALRQR